MLKQLIPPLIASALGALIGGWITYSVVTEDTKTRLRMNAYGSFLSVATDTLSRSEEQQLTEEDLEPFSHALNILTFSASHKVYNKAVDFFVSLTVQDNPHEQFAALLEAMRAEVMGEEMPTYDLTMPMPGLSTISDIEMSFWLKWYFFLKYHLGWAMHVILLACAIGVIAGFSAVFRIWRRKWIKGKG